ncbi:hypothetical protein TeGR_g13788 [Tetraparma gracilis]|uniref:Tyrosine-protein kinase ephrin type A/B receptor-like domain-containing protein n=1 Tax=Tetraparma gracilis TaxID=2962635 RepID=A0ABQ6MAC0_9STRA|nr:hypothetical protein TeGR_g13788 [Tetraparma gracilis]
MRSPRPPRPPLLLLSLLLSLQISLLLPLLASSLSCSDPSNPLPSLSSFETLSGFSHSCRFIPREADSSPDPAFTATVAGRTTLSWLAVPSFVYPASSASPSTCGHACRSYVRQSTYNSNDMPISTLKFGVAIVDSYLLCHCSSESTDDGAEVGGYFTESPPGSHVLGYGGVATRFPYVNSTGACGSPCPDGTSTCPSSPGEFSLYGGPAEYYFGVGTDEADTCAQCSFAGLAGLYPEMAAAWSAAGPLETDKQSLPYPSWMLTMLRLFVAKYNGRADYTTYVDGSSYDSDAHAEMGSFAYTGVEVTEDTDNNGLQRSRCAPCPAGYEGNALDGGETCSACPAGQARQDYSDRKFKGYPLISWDYQPPTSCSVCKDYEFTATPASAECDECPRGYTYDGKDGGRSECTTDRTECSAGSFCRENIEITCLDGTFQPSTGSGSCLPCPQGTSTSRGAVSPGECTQCSAGEFQSTVSRTGNEICTDLPSPQCLAYPYTSVEADKILVQTCNACNTGFYQSTTGSTSCDMCPGGKSTDMQTGSTDDSSCVPCLPGSYMDPTGVNPEPWKDSKPCLSCTDGKYNPNSGASTCAACPAGYTTPSQGSTSPNHCIMCAAGKYERSNRCVDCHLGAWNPDPGTPAITYESEIEIEREGEHSIATSGCSLCPSGTYQNATDVALGCQPCPAGSMCCWSYDQYVSEETLTLIPQCYEPTTTDKAVGANLETCPVGRWGAEGDSCSNRCAPGTYSVTEGATSIDVCLPCPEGYYCPGENAQTAPNGGVDIIYAGKIQCPAGSYCEANAPAPTLCLPGSSTAGGKGKTHKKDCVNCLNGTAAELEGSGDCDDCLSGTIELNLHHIIRLKIYSTFAQLLCLVMYVEVPWPPLVRKFSQIFYALSFNIEVAHPECSVELDFYDKLKMVVLTPIGMALLLVLLSKFLKWQCNRYDKLNDIGRVRFYRKKWKLLRQVMVIFVTSVYTPVCYYSLRTFETCVKAEGGALVMPGDTRIVCTGPEYELHTTFSWMALIAFGVGIPVAIVCLVGYLKRRHLLNSGDTLLRYGALYEWYNDKYSWFEAVSLARKGLMLLPVTLISNSLYQAVGMMVVTVLYALVIIGLKPFIRFPLTLRVVNYEVDFYNFLEATTALATGFDLLLGTLASLDSTREAASAIGVTFILVNTIVVVIAVSSFEAGLRRSKKKGKPAAAAADGDEPTTGLEGVIDAMARPVLARDMRRAQMGSMRQLGSQKILEENMGVVSLTSKFKDIISEADAETQEFAERWEEEYVMMLESKAECNYGDADAVKRQLIKTREKLAEECRVIVRNRQVLASQCDDDELRADAEEKSKQAEELLTHVLKTWVDSQEERLTEELNAMKDEHSKWLIEFHARIETTFKQEAFQEGKTQSGQDITAKSALARLHARQDKDRKLSSGYDGLLGKILLDNDEEKMKLVDKTEELMFAACASNDFRVAYFLEENMKRVVMQHEDDADAIAYRRSPTKQGRGEIMLRVRQKKVRRYLPDVAILSILMGTFLLIVASQIQMTVPFVAWCGIIQFLTGVVSVMAANNYRHWTTYVIGLMCVAQLICTYFAYCDCFRLSMFRSMYTIPAEWRDSDVYKEGYAEWWLATGMLTGPLGTSGLGGQISTFVKDEYFIQQCTGSIDTGCMEKHGGQASDVAAGPVYAEATPTMPTPFDYSCSETNNIIVSQDDEEAEYTWGWTLEGSNEAADVIQNVNLPTNGEEYLEQYKVSHMYGQCGGCSRSPNEVNRPLKFDVALWEKTKQPTPAYPTLHNCFTEMFMKPVRKDGVIEGYEFLDVGVPGFPPTQYDDYKDEYFSGKRQFWNDESGHCRSAPQPFFDRQTEADKVRPLAFGSVYDVEALAEVHGDKAHHKHRSLFVEGISHCSSCREGFELVPLQKVNLLNPECVGAKECKADPHLQQATGVCVRSFNAVGDAAIEDLKSEVLLAFGDDGFMDTAHKEVSCGLLMFSMYIAIMTLYLAGFATPNILVGLRGKTFKSTDEAIRFDKVKISTLMSFATFVLLFLAPTNIWAPEAQSSSTSNVQTKEYDWGYNAYGNVYTSLVQFLNPSLADGSVFVSQANVKDDDGTPFCDSDTECKHPLATFLKINLDKSDYSPNYCEDLRKLKDRPKQTDGNNQFQAGDNPSFCAVDDKMPKEEFDRIRAITSYNNAGPSFDRQNGADASDTQRGFSCDVVEIPTAPGVTLHDCRSSYFGKDGSVYPSFWSSNRLFALWAEPETDIQYMQSIPNSMGVLWSFSLGMGGRVDFTSKSKYMNIVVPLVVAHQIVRFLRVVASKVGMAGINFLEWLMIKCWRSGAERDTWKWLGVRRLLCLLVVLTISTMGHFAVNAMVTEDTKEGQEACGVAKDENGNTAPDCSYAGQSTENNEILAFPFFFIFFCMTWVVTSQLGKTLSMLMEVSFVVFYWGMMWLAVMFPWGGQLPLLVLSGITTSNWTSENELAAHNAAASNVARSYISWEYQMHFLILCTSLFLTTTALLITKVMWFKSRAAENKLLLRVWKVACCCCCCCWWLVGKASMV